MENKNQVEEKKSKKHIIIIVIAIIILIILIAFAIFYKQVLNKPVLFLETFEKDISLSENNEFVIDIKLSKLLDNTYPAASVFLEFDSNKLTFLGTKQGNMEAKRGNSTYIPEWTSDIESSNLSGVVRTMFIDMSAGDESYAKETFSKDNNILVRLVFKLKDSSSVDDQYTFKIQNAVIATVDGDKDNTSLDSESKTLRTDNLKINIVK